MSAPSVGMRIYTSMQEALCQQIIEELNVVKAGSSPVAQEQIDSIISNVASGAISEAVHAQVADLGSRSLIGRVDFSAEASDVGETDHRYDHIQDLVRKSLSLHSQRESISHQRSLEELTTLDGIEQFIEEIFLLAEKGNEDSLLLFVHFMDRALPSAHVVMKNALEAGSYYAIKLFLALCDARSIDKMFFYSCLQSTNPTFIEALITEAQRGNSLARNALITKAVVQSDFNLLSSLDPSIYNKELSFAIILKLHVDQVFRVEASVDGDLAEDLPLHIIPEILFSYLNRQSSLEEIVLGKDRCMGIVIPKTEFSATESNMPRVSSLRVGNNYLEKDELGRYLQDIVGKYGVLVEETRYEHGMWLQDLCTVLSDGKGKIAYGVPTFSLLSQDRPYQAQYGLGKDIQHLVRLNIYRSKSIHVSVNFGYDEGGNSLIGVDSSGRKYVIMGVDSFKATKEAIRRDMQNRGIEITIDNRVIYELIARDYGIDVKELHIVSQPGVFHLDMAMHIVGDRIVLLNDSVLAAAYMEQEATEKIDVDVYTRRAMTSSMFTKADIVARDETKVQQQLIAKGFIVERLPSNVANPYKESSEYHQINLLNHLSLLINDDPPKKLIITQWAPEAFQKRFIELMQRLHGREVVIEFLPQEWSQKSLACSGGVLCRTKYIP